MGRKQGPRKGSMQIWPRKRSYDFLPRVNWAPISSNSSKISQNSDKVSLLGFIGYKAGMMSAFVKDSTQDSMTKNKRIILPVTILECPPIKVLSVRFYRGNNVLKDVLAENLNKELKRIIKLPKKLNTKEAIEKASKMDFDDITLVVYSEASKSELKKTPDIAEIALSGKKEDKLEFAKSLMNKEISVTDVFQKGTLDVRGLTKGKGFQGPVKRFGIRLRSHKAEKGQRKPGSIGAWHPVGVRYTVPRPGQLGHFSRISYNNSILSAKKFSEADPISKKHLNNYGVIRTDYIILVGSVQGPQKRQLLLTSSLRPTKNQSKKNYELIELR